MPKKLTKEYKVKRFQAGFNHAKVFKLPVYKDKYYMQGWRYCKKLKSK